MSAYAEDCNSNGIDDAIDISSNGWSDDCNTNSIPDECDIEAGTSQDCNSNGLIDDCDINWGVSSDTNTNGIPDECELPSGSVSDCNQNEIPDDCDLDCGTEGGVCEQFQCGESYDCNNNGIPDECDIANEFSEDCNGNLIPDDCDILDGRSEDCNTNGVPDICDIASGISTDCDSNGVPDECVSLPPVDIVFVLDDSDLMRPYYISDPQHGGNRMLRLIYFIEERLTGPNVLSEEGIDLKSIRLGIAREPLPSTDPDVPSGFIFHGSSHGGYSTGYTPCSNCPLFSQGSWGHSITGISGGTLWRENAVRIIVPMSNEAPCEGSDVDDENAYDDAIEHEYCDRHYDDHGKPYDDCSTDNSVTEGAIREAMKHDVFVFPVMGNKPAGMHLARNTFGPEIALRTGGTLLELPDVNADLSSAADTISTAILTKVREEYHGKVYYDPARVWGSGNIPRDCDGVGGPDVCEIGNGSKSDYNENQIPDVCEGDCNANGINDIQDIHDGTSEDLQGNWIPDECEEEDILIYGSTSGLHELLDDYLSDETDCYRKSQIWLLEGTYRSETGSAFQLSRHLQIYGGFYYEDGGLKRDPINHPTILSGDTGISGTSTRRILYSFEKPGVLLDGLIVEGASSSAASTEQEEQDNETLCIDGSGMVVDGGWMTIRNCIFRDNIGYGVGAGIAAKCTKIETFEQNVCKLTLENCVLENNQTDSSKGGGLGAFADVNVDSNSTLEIKMKNCMFSGNYAANGGGGVYVEGHLGTSEENSSRAIFTAVDCVFSGNGSGMDGENPVYSWRGGGVELMFAESVIERCQFTDNTVTHYGGGLYATDSILNIDHCIFERNDAVDLLESYGGGLSLCRDGHESTCVVQNTRLSNNEAAFGGGLNVYGGELVILNSTIADNTALVKGSGIDCSDHAWVNDIDILNSIVYSNKIEPSGGTTSTIEQQIEQYLGGGSELSIAYSTIENGMEGVSLNPDSTLNWEVGNSPAGTDPGFLMPGFDYRLLPNSPCRDVGDNHHVLDGALDLDGADRIQHGGTGRVVDMGAYESRIDHCDGLDAYDLPFDYDDDCDIDLEDYKDFQVCFDSSDALCLEEFDTVTANGIVDYDDLGELISILESMGGPLRTGNTQTGIANTAAAMPSVQFEPVMQEFSSPQVNSWSLVEGDLSLVIKPIGGGSAVTILQPHTSYKLKYQSDYPATDCSMVVYAVSSQQGLDNAASPAHGDWSDTGNFEYIDLSGTDLPEEGYADGLIRTDVIANSIEAPSGTHGKLLEFTTGDPGVMHLHVELDALDETTLKIVHQSAVLEIVVQH